MIKQSQLINNLPTIILTSAVVSALISSVFIFLSDFMRRRSEEKRFKIEATLKLTELAHGQLNELLKNKPSNVKIRVPKVIRTFLSFRKRIEDVWNNKNYE